MTREDLCEDRMLRLGDGDGHRESIPGREDPVQTPELAEQACSRHRTKEGTAEARRARGKEVGHGERGMGFITGSC